MTKAILVVDDNEAIRKTLAKLLQRFGFTIFVAGSEQKAKMRLTQIRTRGVDLRYAFIDVNLTDDISRQEGLSLASRIGGQLSGQTTVFLMSGLAENERFAPEVGADGFIHKPFELEDIIELLDPSDRTSLSL